MYGIVYAITNNLDNKIYVGQTTRTLEERFNQHIKADSLLGRAIQRDGARTAISNVKCEIRN